MDPLTAAVVQLNSQDDVTKNLSRVSELAKRARDAGAEIISLPENFAFFGDEEKKREIAEEISGFGEIVSMLTTSAKELGAWIVAGGLPEKSEDFARPFNTSLLISPKGEVVSKYRKIHLFDVDIPGAGPLTESAATAAGTEPCLTEARGVPLGMTVCYDVRFPELYTKLALAGARVITVPAAFTLMTGKDHWNILLRARAIENEVFILAPAQAGKHPRGRQTYGKSLIVDPWGDVIAQVGGSGEGFAVARLDFSYQDEVRRALPCLSHKKIKLA
ncbi:MAG: carbon-nitrogen hydrolase family protein [Polyangiaceae bacterium]